MDLTIREEILKIREENWTKDKIIYTFNPEPLRNALTSILGDAGQCEAVVYYSTINLCFDGKDIRKSVMFRNHIKTVLKYIENQGLKYLEDQSLDVDVNEFCKVYF